ncbi:hypothetical protein [Micromonospora sp. NPDC049645]|uniref:hypothetical protein n=1 Tax=Micromonospora sp. NPDC049645 TaxID=3155508 RepID=UPI00341DF7F1
MAREANISARQAASSRRARLLAADGGDEVGKLLLVANTALVGVPSAYAVSGSLAVTAIAALLAVALVAAWLMPRSR